MDKTKAAVAGIFVGMFIFALSKVRADERIQVIAYNPLEVVPIYTSIGNPTLIQFEDDESVADTDKSMLGMGDAKAWSVGAKGNSVLLKPIAKEADTKLLIVTTKRTYAFDITTAKNNILPTLIVRFDYPDSRKKLALLAEKKQKIIDERLVNITAKEDGVVKTNSNYMKQGDQELAPSQVTDNGRFTFMRFDSDRELPVIYKLLPDGTEALTNSHMDSESGTVVIHEVASNFILRYGNAVLALRNNGFNPNGKLNLPGTTLSNAVRLNKGEM